VISALQQSSQVADATLSTVFVAGAVASLGLCAAVRLPVIFAYIAGVAHSKRHGVILSALFAFGLIAGTVWLGITAAPADDGLHRVLCANKYLCWIVGVALFITGVLLSGLINPQLLPEQWQAKARKLIKAGSPGAFLLGAAFGLLQMPACPTSGSVLGAIAEVAGRGDWLHGLVLFAGFAVGQSFVLFAVGLLTSFARPELLLRLRTRMCSIEQRVQLLAGNVLMVLGLYFVIVS
jgi:cytochrome c biogenesis protein CcdA